MQTSFTAEQLKDPDNRSSEKVLRACVHCGFCTATCPTYVLLGDELDSPRGRIYLMKQMLESGGPPSPETVKHIDRCLSCLSCMTTCPSGVHYMHLVDHGRSYIGQHFRRPPPRPQLPRPPLPPAPARPPAPLAARADDPLPCRVPAGATRGRPGAAIGRANAREPAPDAGAGPGLGPQAIADRPAAGVRCCCCC